MQTERDFLRRACILPFRGAFLESGSEKRSAFHPRAHSGSAFQKRAGLVGGKTGFKKLVSSITSLTLIRVLEIATGEYRPVSKFLGTKRTVQERREEQWLFCVRGRFSIEN